MKRLVLFFLYLGCRGAIALQRWTCRITVVGALEHYLRQQEPYLFACRHQDMLFTLLYLLDQVKDRKLAILVSLSRDGDLATYLLQKLGVRVVRGSSTRGGGRGMVELCHLVRREGYSAVVICDGPKAPGRAVKKGIVGLAKLTGRPIIKLRSWAQHQGIVRRNWARFALVYPWSRVVIMTDEPFPVPRQAARHELEKYRQQIETGLETLATRAEAYFTG